MRDEHGQIELIVVHLHTRARVRFFTRSNAHPF